MRLPNVDNDATSLTGANMKRRLVQLTKNAVCAVCIFCLLTVIGGFHRSGKDDLDHPLPLLLDNPRFRRAILNSTPERSKVQFGREGPLVELGPTVPQRLGTDVFISVKTTRKYHSTRLSDIMDTWFRLAPENIYFFTDAPDSAIDQATAGHLVDTNCPSTHSRQALCCKMNAELEHFLDSGRSWMCHFDDDNYVNVPQLMRLLGNFDPRRDWYLGRPSTRGPIDIFDRMDEPAKKVTFWFATGGAGFCLSKSLVTKMAPYVRDGKFRALGEKIRLPDDVTLGYLIEHLLGKRLTVVDKLHSHLESMRLMRLEQLHEQISLSAGSYNEQKPNVVSVSQLFSDAEDPQHFRSLHCFLFPKSQVCAGRSPLPPTSTNSRAKTSSEDADNHVR